jgi:hypothetical protein
MNVSRDSILALQRHFLGALSTPAGTWLELLPARQLTFCGAIVGGGTEGCLLDLGTVVSPGQEYHRVRVAHRGSRPLTARIESVAPWVSAGWLDTTGDAVTIQDGDRGVILELRATHGTEGELLGVLRLLVEEEATRRVEELTLRMTARRIYPIAVIDFNGSPVPRPFDFGTTLQPYELSIQNVTAVPLVVSFADLPEWLRFEVDGHRRDGPLPGRFFERTAPVTAKLQPTVLGRHSGSVRLQTNDHRPELRSVELHFAACVETEAPSVHAIAPPRIRLRADQALVLAMRLENWGRVAARVASRSALPQSLEVPARSVVPPARQGAPGTTVLSVRIVAAQLAPGTHVVDVTLLVDDGEPPTLTVPLHIEVMAARSRRAIAPRPAIALFVALLLALVFALVLWGWP